MSQEMLIVDGLQYSNWSREIFEQMHEGGVDAVHATLAYHETTRDTLSRFGEWNRRFEAHHDLIMPVREPADIQRAREAGKVGILLGAQNCSRGRHRHGRGDARPGAADHAAHLQ